MADRKPNQRDNDTQEFAFLSDTAEKRERKKADQKSARWTEQDTERALKSCENGHTASAEYKVERYRYQAAMRAE